MKQYLSDQIRAVLAQYEQIPADFEVQFQPPAKPEFGDLATNVAMQLARHLGKAPRVIAQDLVQHLALDPDRIASVEIAGAGFINFRFSNRYLYNGLAHILAQGAQFGRGTHGNGKKAMVEFVSANPTGPLTVGHGRNAALGDTMANLLDWIGYDVTREYYFNDGGNQMRNLANSVRARYVERLQPDCPKKVIDNGVIVPEIFPQEGYQGGYIYDIADVLIAEHGDALLEGEHTDLFKKAAQDAIFKDIEKTMLRMNIKMNSYFNEMTLYTNGKIEETLAAMREKGFVYEKDGATWFETTRLGKDRDVVLVKSSGEPTYRMPDIAYHINKLGRGFDLCVDLFGADHIDTYPDVLSALHILGYDEKKIEVVIYQFVTLMRGGEAVKMSTRKANFVTVDDLMDEVTEDVTRFFFLMVSPNTHINFDLDLAKEASQKNPCFYLQYAHARICSIIRKAEEVGFKLADNVQMDVLTHEAEIQLIKALLRFPDEVKHAALTRLPQRLINYLQEAAAAFHQFYHDCRIIGEDEAIATARMALAKAAQLVMKNGLTILGISAPEKM
jgi:arginyl-tRNA synthetase